MSCKYLYFTEKDLQQRWNEVKSEEEFWSQLSFRMKKMTKITLESVLEEEMRVYVNAKRYQRTEGRTDQRNGSYERDLLTTLGFITGIQVPRCRRKGFKSKVIPRYQRRQERVTEVLKEMCVVGVSRRRAKDITEPLLEAEVSPGTLSNIFAELDREVRAFQRKRLKDEYRYLFLDGIYVSIKGVLKASKKPVLVAYGVKKDGIRELIHFKLSRSESQSEWEAFLNNLYRRGLIGEELELIITDGAKGLKAALDVVYPYPKRQLCWAHKMRNVANYVPKKYHAECVDQARLIYKASSKREAVGRFREWESEWELVIPKAVRCIGRDLDRLLSFFDFPKEHWKKIRTTNAIERALREVRRRTYANGCFAHTESCERTIYTVAVHMNRKWREKALKGF